MFNIEHYKTYRFDNVKKMVYEFCRPVSDYLFIGTYKYYCIDEWMSVIKKEEKIKNQLMEV